MNMNKPPGAVEIVAELNGRIVGEVTIERRSRNIFFCTGLYVDRDHRRQGIGRALMASAEQYAAARGATIRVEVPEGNWGARAFFGATGWRR